MDLEFCRTGVLLLIVLFLLIYSVLDGFDLGIGMLLPFARSKGEAARLVSLISPFWDGNEVWLVIAAGFVFAAFPALLGLLLGAVYLPFLLLVAGLILRAIALDYSYHDPSRQALWHRLAAGGSGLVVTLGLFFLGTILNGLPFDGPAVLSQRADDYVALFPVLFSFTGIVVVVWHGAAYAYGREPSDAGLLLLKRLWPVLVAASVVLGVAWLGCLPKARIMPLFLAGVAIYAGGVAAGRARLARPGWAFRGSVVSLAGLWLMIVAGLYPEVLPARNHPEWSLTLANASAPLPTLRILTILGLVVTPVIALYSVFIYRVFHKPLSNRGG